ncbi:ABC transporter substrate-binding protein [Paenibacillus thalictri]|uniref:Extracellular solute-binding protein n=1 Tax=Paenibacillus thalictri TaxID=2527873 RepID=A0A4Q9DS89_9BACL|nr:extracellular solute-binding protein [Paenibacillus thalictri]TBL76614.1 extracellular solute-binding protein [Paenibacillus thalictri]
MLKRKAAAAALLALLILMTGCMPDMVRFSPERRQAEPAPVKITMWNVETLDRRQTILQESIRTFNETHKQMQIVPFFYETEAYKNKLRVAMVSGNMPDLFQYWSGESFKRMVDSHAVADVTDLLEQSRDLKRQYIPEALQSVTYDGRIYGFPHTIQRVVVWYNKAMFAEHGLQPPQSWADLIRIIQVLSQKGITSVSVAGKDRWPLLHWFAYINHRLGGEPAFKKTVSRAGDFSDPAFLEAGLKFRELVKNKAFIPGFLGMDVIMAEKAFLAGEAAMYIQGDWVAGKLMEDEKQKNNIGYFGFPEMPGVAGEMEYYGGYAVGWAMSAGSKQREASFEALQFLLDKKERVKYAQASGANAPFLDMPLTRPAAGSAIYDYMEHVAGDRSGFFGFYDQEIEPRRAQLLLDAVVTLASEEELSREEIEAIMAQIR